MTQEDADLIGEFTNERKANCKLSDGHVNKIIYHLVDWRRYVGIFTKNTITDIHEGINRLYEVRINGRPYKRNTLHDNVEFLRQFYIWLIELGKVDILLPRLLQVKPPSVDRITKNSKQLLTEDEVGRMKVVDGAGFHNTHEIRQQNVPLSHYSNLYIIPYSSNVNQVLC
ncbi:MAG TPA: hypothetical protein VMW77_01365 [Methanoregula sp.]|nr:hypothetical protein [Methanoregula sp.]